MGFFSAVKKFFTGGSSEKKQEKPVEEVKVEAVAKAEESAPAEAPAKTEAEAEPAFTSTTMGLSTSVACGRALKVFAP